MSGTLEICGVTHEWHTCITCGVIYTVPKVMIDKQREKGGFHSCCNGHAQGWSKEESENEKTRRERDRLRQQLAQKDDEIRSKERELAAERTKAAKVKKRSGAGVCPCCNRTVGQMARHMKSKHPQFVAEAVNDPAATLPAKTH
jgi:hypothetical protein